MSVKPTLLELILNATAAGKSMLSAANAAAQKTLLSLVKGDVGLGNVDNTSDANKPVSTAQQTALDAKADLVGGVVPSAQIPAIAITEYLGSVASQVAMLALTGDRGDWCLRSDTGTTFVLSDDDSSLLASWVELNYPTAPVTSVNGETGAVTLSASDVGAAATSHTHAQSDVTGLVSDLSGKQATLVSGTNIKTINSTSLLGSGDISVGVVGGSTGSTDNRVLRADGTGGTTAQNSAVTIDDSGNVTGVGTLSASNAITSATNFFATNPANTLEMGSLRWASNEFLIGVEYTGTNGYRATKVVAPDLAASSNYIGISANQGIDINWGGGLSRIRFLNAGTTISGGTTAINGPAVVTAQSVAQVPLTAKGAASHSGDLVQILTSAGGLWGRIYPNGGNGVSLWLSGSAAGGTSRGFTMRGDAGTGQCVCTTDISAGFSFEGTLIGTSSTSTTSMLYCDIGLRIGRNVGASWTMTHGTYFADVAARSVMLSAADAYTSAATNTVGGSFTINAGAGGPSNSNGGAVTLQGGKGRGTGTPGVVVIQTTVATASGTTLQTLRDCLKCDGNTTAGETPLLLLDIDKGTLQRVSIGASDSGGTGFKVLRVPN